MIWEVIDQSDESIYCNQYDWSKVRPSTAVIDAIRTVKRGDRVSMQRQQECNLSQHVDLEAIDGAILGQKAVVVSFQVDEYVVHVDPDSVVVERL